MTLKQLIKLLEMYDPTTRVRHGFSHPHSYRGFYEQLAFEPDEHVTVGSMLADAKSALGTVFEGYKGGQFCMDQDTNVWLASYGSSGEAMTESVVRYMIECGSLVNVFETQLKEARAERDEARANAIILAHAHVTNSTPPQAVVDAALAYPINHENL